MEDEKLREETLFLAVTRPTMWLGVPIEASLPIALAACLTLIITGNPLYAMALAGAFLAIGACLNLDGLQAGGPDERREASPRLDGLRCIHPAQSLVSVAKSHRIAVYDGPLTPLGDHVAFRGGQTHVDPRHGRA